MEPEFSDETAAAVRRAGERLQEALGTQIELAARARQDSDLAEVDDAAEAVRELLADYAQALLEHCGEPAPFEDSVEEPEPESDDDGSTLVSRLARTDFMIVDEPALLADGARAGAESGSAPPPELDPAPMTVSRAIRLIVSAHGPDGLWRAGGVRPLWSETIILRPDPVEIDDADEPDEEEFEDPLSIFDVDGEIVSTESEQFFR